MNALCYAVSLSLKQHRRCCLLFAAVCGFVESGNVFCTGDTYYTFVHLSLMSNIMNLLTYLLTRRTTSQERLHAAAPGALLYNRRHKPRQNNTRIDSCWSRYQQSRQPQMWQVSYRARHSTSAAQLCKSAPVPWVTGNLHAASCQLCRSFFEAHLTQVAV